MRRLFISLFVATTILSCSSDREQIELSLLEDKIAGAWIGQMVGNMYGLPHENKYVESPGDDTQWPYGYSKSLDKLERYQGAFSDDDTDIEYVYLSLMEKYGLEPTYAQIREGWMYHIRDRVWLANRAAVGLMNYGFTPPYSGSEEYNPHWFQIDPQLINEIWAYTAPGMTGYAAAKSEWAARITSDKWAVVPTIHYGAMYAEAFFEKDIEKIIVKALEYLPKGDRYRESVLEMIDLYHRYPSDWKKARAIMAQKNYIEEDEMTKTIWNANLNGCCGILALLYGQGDLQKTMDYGCAMGFDCDNQTATIGGLLGVIYGASSFEDKLTMPIEGWTEPFNDRYVNITRYDMPDASIKDIIKRTIKLALDNIVKNGGSVDGNVVTVNRGAKFISPMEFCVGPNPILEVGKESRYDFTCVTNSDYKFSLVGGELPCGMTFKDGQLSGKPTMAGDYTITLSLSDGKKSIEKSFDLVVRGKNIAFSADTIYASVREMNSDVLFKCWYTFGKPMYAKSVDVIRDGKVNGRGSVFYSLSEHSDKYKKDYFGYGWKELKTIDMLAFNSGCMEEFGGWFEKGSVKVEYLNPKGEWREVEDFSSFPPLPASDTVFVQPHFTEYLFRFKPVTTTGIRVIGVPYNQEHWNKPTKGCSRFISITELSAYEYSPKEIRLTKEDLRDKIRGGWAGQTIGVVYGAPTEFKFTGTTIQDYHPLYWDEHYIKYWWDKKPGLFDDIYNDITFVESFQEEGLDCSQEKLALRFATPEYHLAHANQAGRYNIRNGIMPPASGHWINNPHADDLDFQIEADFIGMMAPALLPEALDIADRVGHIMNSGDGFYGGAFVAALYSAAFTTTDPSKVLDMALSTIPSESTFYKCIDDVRKFHAQYPDDWRSCWFEIHKKWNKDVGCPKGVFLSFNIDAKINSAYVAIGLLYGEGDFGKSIEIATRCGQDSDCNPSTVGGVLGVMKGFSGIPKEWSNPLLEIENLTFEGSNLSLAKAVEYSYQQSLGMIEKAGGEVLKRGVVIPQRECKTLPLEQNFIDTYPKMRERKDCFMDKDYKFEFEGNGFIIWGNICCLRSISADYISRVSNRHIGSEVFGLAEASDTYVAEVEVWIDGKLDSTNRLPMKNTDRRLEPAWKYGLKEGKHKVELKWLNPHPEYLIRINDIVYYTSKPTF